MSAENTELFDKLKELFVKVFDDEIDITGVTPESRLVEDLGMKSIGMLYMAMAVEEEFGVKFVNEDFPKIKTVNDIMSKIEGTL